MTPYCNYKIAMSRVQCILGIGFYIVEIYTGRRRYEDKLSIIGLELDLHRNVT